MLTIEEIRNNYKTLSDSKIEKIALFESKKLKKEFIDVLRDEIKERNLSPNLLSWVDAETDTFKPNEIESLKRKINVLACPKCSMKTNNIYGFELNKIMSFLIFTKETNQNMILCKSCGNKEKANWLFTTFLFGWWSLNGFLTTINIIVKDSINFMYLNKISNRVLDKVIKENTGHLRINGTDDESLLNFLKEYNMRK